MIEERRVLSDEFEAEVKGNPDKQYLVCPFVSYDVGFEDEMLFEDGKGKLLEFIEERGIHVYNSLDSLPSASVSMTGSQILELSQQDYIDSILPGTDMFKSATSS